MPATGDALRGALIIDEPNTNLQSIVSSLYDLVYRMVAECAFFWLQRRQLQSIIIITDFTHTDLPDY